MRPVSSPHLEYTYDALSIDDVAAASTRAPSFDMAAIASIAGLRDSCGHVPLDAWVPVRSSVGIPLEMGSKMTGVLGQVDGRRSLEEIGADLQLSLPETIEAFLQLFALGLVSDEPQSSRSRIAR